MNKLSNNLDLSPIASLGADLSPAQLFSFSTAQGLVAVAWEYMEQQLQRGGVDAESLPRTLKLRWALTAEGIVKDYHRRRELSVEFADMMQREGIEVYSLKGLSLAQYYPRAELRECGDFDCWMGDDFQRGNSLAQQLGADFDPHDYRHSLIYYKGLMIENHRFFLVLRGNARNKRLERYLRDIIRSERRFEGSNIHLPSAQFQAQFTVLHMMHHFLYESIIVRHILDWHYLVQRERDNVDWREFNLRCQEAGVDRFVAALNHICIKHFGLDISGTQLKASSYCADRIWNDTFYQQAQHSSGVENIWRQRYIKLQNVVAARWKFNDVYDRGLLRSLTQTAYGMLFDKEVRF